MDKQPIWQKLQTIDRRYIYAALLLFIIVPMFSPGLATRLPIIPSHESISFFNTIEEISKTEPNKLVIVDGMWSAGTRGENKWQAQAILTHLMQRRLHFAILSFDPQNNDLTQQIIRDLAPKYHYVYGQDYVNWGYRPSSVEVQTLKGIAHDIPGALKADWKGRPLQEIPVMRGVHNTKDISAIIEITPSGSVAAWIGLVQKDNKPPILYAPTAVMAPDIYPFLDSGQIAGLLTGIKGAGDYEKLTKTPTFGTRATGALSLVYTLIIILIILGNAGYYIDRKQKQKEQQ